MNIYIYILRQSTYDSERDTGHRLVPTNNEGNNKIRNVLVLELLEQDYNTIMNNLSDTTNKGLAPTNTSRGCILLLYTVTTFIFISIVVVSTCQFVGKNDDNIDTTGTTTGIVSILFHHLYYYHSTNKRPTSSTTNSSSNHVSDRIYQSNSDRQQQEPSEQQHQQQQQYYQHQYQQKKELYSNNERNNERVLTTAFGTHSGYDVGGTDSMCWITTMSDTTLYNTTGSSSSTSSTTGNTSTSNDPKGTLIEDQYTILDNYFAQSNFNTTKLLSNCYNRTTLMTVQPLNETEINALSDSYYYTNTSYTYNLTVQVDLQHLFNNSNSNNNNDTNSMLQHLINGKSNTSTNTSTSSITIRSEYILCNAIRMGFCHPLRIHEDTSNNPTTSTDTNTSSTQQQVVSHEIIRYKNGQTINGIGIDNELIRSPWIEWDIHRSDNLNTTSTSTVFTSSINVLFSFPIGITPGAYFFIGHSVLYYYDTDDNMTTIMKRLDIADAIPDNIVEIKDEPIIIYMSYGMKVFLSCIIGLFSTIALSMFIFILYNMNHIVMQLTQGPFLAAITFACFIKIICTVTYFPIYDTFCSISTIVISVPQTLIGSIVIARIWRAYSTLHVVTRFARRNDTKNNNTGKQLVETLLLRFLNTLANPMSIITKITSICNNCSRRSTSLSNNNVDGNVSNNNNLRRTVVARDSIVLIIMLVLPQLVVQIVAVIVNHSYLIIDYHDNIQSGRAICSHYESWQLYFSLTYLVFIYVIAIILAYMSKDLPSVFNEKDEIFTVAFIDAFIVSTSLALQAVLNIPSTTPNMIVITNVSIAIAMSVNSLYFVIYPKIKRVLNNETIVVSNMLGTNKYNNDNSNVKPVQFYSPTTTTTTGTISAAPAVSGTACNGANDNEQEQQQEQQLEHHNGINSTTNGALTLSTETMSSLPPVDNNNSTNPHPHMLVRNGDPVPACIEKQLHQLQLFLRDITNNLCDGKTLSQEEWQCLKDDVSSLQNSLGKVELADR